MLTPALAVDASNDLSRLLAAGWIKCVLDTFMIIKTLRGAELNIKPFEKNSKEEQGWNKKTIEDFERHVLETAVRVYEAICLDLDQEVVFFARKNVIYEMKTWLEWRLPLFLSPVYVPMFHDSGEERRKAIMEFLEEKSEKRHKGIMDFFDAKDESFTPLVAVWKTNPPYPVYDIKGRLVAKFSVDKGVQFDFENNESASKHSTD